MNVVQRRAVDSTAGAVILPPGQRLAEMSRDKEPNLPRGQPVISQFLVVVQTRHNGLS